ncbi:MAG TPA: VWA domain-containing protein [Xanthobacteraceae bacterium]|jgi:Flp pilus assembly protein TadG|nr:VWA domain-containing protein [Xanthobacteraceae bacterium]
MADAKGGVAPMLAIALVPIVGTVAASIDYSRAAAARTAMQAVLDSTALMLAREAKTLSNGTIQSEAQSYFNANYNRPEVSNVSIAAQVSSPTPGNYVVDVSASAVVHNAFTGVIGKPTTAITGAAQSIWGIKKLNLSLVLDNTGSMAQSGKMTALKSAAHSLLDTLQQAQSTPGDVQVSIIPFATDVNVGTNNVSASWIDWTEWNASNTTKTKVNGQTVTTPKSHDQWNGCVWDRDQNYDVTNTPPQAGSVSTQFRAHQASNCPAAMIPLSYDWTALNSKVDDMTPTGNTNITIGLAWGWQSLTDAAPLNAPAPSSDLEKVIVLLTDGDNTQNRWTTSANAIDARTATLCANIKADNIQIYTVRVIDGNASLLKGCATSSSMYYEVQSAPELNGVFSAIAQNLASLRLTK